MEGFSCMKDGLWNLNHLYESNEDFQNDLKIVKKLF